MQVTWSKCTGDVWCNLLTLNLRHEQFRGVEGVYIIWHGGPKPAVVYVGQGAIAQRLETHRENPAILAFSRLGLFVTWAWVRTDARDGVERHLANRLRPLVGVAHPITAAIEVNLPW
jgi:hypothetical protein